MSNARGRFIVLEGWEASGKSTQAAALGEALDAVVTRQPGDSSIGSTVRGVLLDSDAQLVPWAEALLFAADRAQHVAEVIEPALAAGRHVVCDRYTYSSVAYQGYGRGLDPAAVAQVSAWATGGLEPDVVVLLDLPFDAAVDRLGAERDRIERGEEAFLRRAHGAFHTLAAADPERWVVVDGDAAPDVVTERCLVAIEAHLVRRGRAGRE